MNVLFNNVEDIFIVMKTCFLVRLKIGRFLRDRQNTPKTSILGHFRGSEQKYSPRAVLPPKTAFLAVFCPYDADQVFRGGQKTALFWPFFRPLFDPQKRPQKRPYFNQRLHRCICHSLVVLAHLLSHPFVLQTHYCNKSCENSPFLLPGLFSPHLGSPNFELCDASHHSFKILIDRFKNESASSINFLLMSLQTL